MEFQKIVGLGLAIFGLGLLPGCNRPLYFATSETQPISTLERQGDFEAQLSFNQSTEFQQSYQASAALAVTPFLAVRGSLLQGGDDFNYQNREYGRINASHLGIGTFYPIKRFDLQASTWFGYSRGTLNSESSVGLPGAAPARPTRLFLSNEYARAFVEQQIRYRTNGLEAFLSLSLGNSQVFGIQQQGELEPDGEYASYIQRQLEKPNRFFGNLGYGISGGTNTLRLHFRIDVPLGPASLQLSSGSIFFMSTGVSWKLQAERWWK